MSLRHYRPNPFTREGKAYIHLQERFARLKALNDEDRVAHAHIQSGPTCPGCEQLKGQIARLRKAVLHEATTSPMPAITRMKLRKAVAR